MWKCVLSKTVPSRLQELALVQEQLHFWSWAKQQRVQNGPTQLKSYQKKTARPEDISELRRVLGLFVQHKDRLPTWGEDSKPLHQFTRNAVKYDWSEKCESCFEKLRSQCLDNNILAALNFIKQFRVATDASAYDKGVHIYRLKHHHRNVPYWRKT